MITDTKQYVNLEPRFMKFLEDNNFPYSFNPQIYQILSRCEPDKDSAINVHATYPEDNTEIQAVYIIDYAKKPTDDNTFQYYISAPYNSGLIFPNAQLISYIEEQTKAPISPDQKFLQYNYFSFFDNQFISMAYQQHAFIPYKQGYKSILYIPGRKKLKIDYTENLHIGF